MSTKLTNYKVQINDEEDFINLVVNCNGWLQCQNKRTKVR